jgi:Acyl-coenzyme A synthetases/AMP-(fatty) acid ligases
MSGEFDSTYTRALTDRVSFWGEAADGIHWDRKWDVVLDDSNPPFYRWFSGGILNTCYNALDRHVEAGRAEQCAIIYDSPMTEQVVKFTYRELRDRVALFAGVLASEGVTKGDRVVIYMPMIPEAVIAMLACARLGAVHSVVFGGFASNELAIRIDDAKPKIVVSASCGLEPGRIVEYKPLLDRALSSASHQPDRSIILQREALRCSMGDNDLDWNDG